MRRAAQLLAVLGMLLPLPAFAGATAAPRVPPEVLLLNVTGVIGPATSDYVHRGLARARRLGAELVILRLDTPGGLDIAMRRIIQDILASPVPVAGFVAPSGARAASAGTYILMASSIAAMAPGTNLGAATPVQLGGITAPGGGASPPKPGPAKAVAPSPGSTEERKMVNDAVAYIRSLAQMRGRNADWAERAVREAASLPAADALRQHVVDLIAADVPDLLAKLDGRRVAVQGREVTLSTRGAVVVTYNPDWRTHLLSVITDPNVAYLLMLLGFYGLFFELWHPGYVLPGVIGGICLLLALYALQVLPINYAGLGLILLGISFMVGEAFMPTFGALGIGGVIAFVVGSIILMNTDVRGYTIAWPLIAAVAVTSGAFFFGVVALALRARRRRVLGGGEAMIGALGEALEAFTGEGRIRVHSEEWQARSHTPLARGQGVKVVARDGLVLTVEPYNAEGD